MSDETREPLPLREALTAKGVTQKETARMNGHLETAGSQIKRGGAESRTPTPFRTISEETCRLVVERFKPGLRSVILTGSLAAGEATTAVQDGVWTFLADVELHLLLHDGTPF